MLSIPIPTSRYNGQYGKIWQNHSCFHYCGLLLSNRHYRLPSTHYSDFFSVHFTTFTFVFGWDSSRDVLPGQCSSTNVPFAPLHEYPVLTQIVLLPAQNGSATSHIRRRETEIHLQQCTSCSWCYHTFVFYHRKLRTRADRLDQ